MRKILISILSAIFSVCAGLFVFACTDDAPAPKPKDPIYPVIYGNIEQLSDENALTEFINGSVLQEYVEQKKVTDNSEKDFGVVLTDLFTVKINGVNVPCYSSRAATGLQSLATITATEKSFPLSVEITLKNNMSTPVILPSAVSAFKVKNKKISFSLSDFGNYTLADADDYSSALTVSVREKTDFVLPEGYIEYVVEAGEHIFNSVNVIDFTGVYIDSSKKFENRKRGGGLGTTNLYTVNAISQGEAVFDETAVYYVKNGDDFNAYPFVNADNFEAKKSFLYILETTKLNKTEYTESLSYYTLDNVGNFRSEDFSESNFNNIVHNLFLVEATVQTEQNFSDQAKYYSLQNGDYILEDVNETYFEANKASLYTIEYRYANGFVEGVYHTRSGAAYTECVNDEFVIRDNSAVVFKSGVHFVKGKISLQSNCLIYFEDGAYIYCNDDGTVISERCSSYELPLDDANVTVVYCDCDAFATILEAQGNTDNINVNKHEHANASDTTVDYFNLTDKRFNEFIKRFEITDELNQWQLTEEDEFLYDKYSEFIAATEKLFGNSKSVKAKIADCDLTLSAVVGINKRFTITFGNDGAPDYQETLKVIAGLFGYNDVNTFVQYADTLISFYIAHAGEDIRQPLDYDGAIFTENRRFIFPFLFENELTDTVLGLVIVNDGIISMWVSNLEAAAFAVNLNNALELAEQVNLNVYGRCSLFESYNNDSPLFDVNGVNGVAICGNALFDFSKTQKNGKPFMIANGVNNLEVSGITLINLACNAIEVKNSDTAQISDVNFIAYRDGSNATTVLNTKNCEIKRSFARTAGVPFTVGTGERIYGSAVCDIVLDGITAITDGVEAVYCNYKNSRSTPNNESKNLTLKNIVAVAFKKADANGAVTVQVQGNNLVSDVELNSIEIYSVGKALSIYSDKTIDISDTSYYTEDQQIENAKPLYNVTLENLNIYSGKINLGNCLFNGLVK